MAMAPSVDTERAMNRVCAPGLGLADADPNGVPSAFPTLDSLSQERIAQRASSHLQSPVLMVAPQPFYENRGTPIALRYVLHALSELGRRVDVLTLPIGEPVEIRGVRIFRTSNPLHVRHVPVGFSMRKFMFDLLLFWKLRQRLRAERYGCVHGVEEGAFLATFLCRRRGVAVIYDMQSSMPEQLAQKPWFAGGTPHSIARSLERWLLRSADFVACSTGLAEYVRSVAPSAALREWRFPATPPSASPDELAALRLELGLPADAQVVLYGGNFAPYQGMEILFEATPKVLAAVPNAFMVFAGASSGQLHHRVGNSTHANRVRVLPRQPRRRMDAFIELASVLVSPRNHGGNFPLKIFDYLAAGKPIVATDVPAHRAVLDDTLALLVPSSPAAIAEGVIRVLRDRALAERLAAAGAAYAREHLTWPIFVRSVDEIYSGAQPHRRLHEANAEPHNLAGC
jgi:glycosyltransferase involved in cell wall biosynthesis